MNYTYKLHKQPEKSNIRYTKKELTEFTTLQLRDICRQAKIIKTKTNLLDREELIKTIHEHIGIEDKEYIETYSEQGHYYLENTINTIGKELNDKNLIQIPSKITLHKGLNIEITDNIEIITNGLIKESLVLLYNENNKLCGIFNLKHIETNKEINKEINIQTTKETTQTKQYLTLNHTVLSETITEGKHKNHYLLFLEEKSKHDAIRIYKEGRNIRPARLNYYKKEISELHIQTPQETENILSIDFGTTNTTAGAYNLNQNQISQTLYINKTEQQETPTNIIPSVIGVKDCRNPEAIKYSFGYEAIDLSRKNNYTTTATVFYNIKRWVNDYNKQEEITDEYGNTTYIKRKHILKEYFYHIIEESQNRHKCKYKNLHITSPVKQKNQYLQMYTETITGYNIQTENTLDEGVAVLYNTIANQIETNNYYEKETYRALIIDCGGGTCDLTGCDYLIEDTKITHKLKIETTYTNGDTNFGGNNITYRIQQLIKIKLAAYYQETKQKPLEEIIEASKYDIYRYVDQNGIDNTYKELETQYQEAEKTIPTKYNAYKNKSTEYHKKVKSNYNFLWDLSEKIKKDLYEQIGKIQTDLNQPVTPNKKHHKEDLWNLNIIKNNKLEQTNEKPEITITKEEINTLIKPDIYNIIKKFLEPIYKEDKLTTLNIIKITGQTCKIEIFRDAIKEYIAGKNIEGNKKTTEKNDLKLTCLEGALKYINAKKIGTIAPEIINKAPITPYKITAKTHINQEITLISYLESLTKSYGYISRHIDTKEIELNLKDADNKEQHKYIVPIEYTNYETTTYEEMKETYGKKIPQADIDSITDNEIKIFVYSPDGMWGYNILPVARKEGELYVGESRYYPFENEEWELNYFDGMK